MENTGCVKSYLIYHNNESRKHWTNSEDVSKHVDYLLYDSNGVSIGCVHAIYKIKASLAVEGIDENTCHAHKSEKDHKSYLKKMRKGVEPKTREVNVLTPLLKDIPHHTAKTIPTGGSEELSALIMNEQNPEEVQETMEEQISELLKKVSYAPDACNERRVEDTFVEMSEASNTIDRLMENTSPETSERIEEP